MRMIALVLAAALAMEFLTLASFASGEGATYEGFCNTTKAS